jgi:HlyD family secretion protein
MTYRSRSNRAGFHGLLMAGALVLDAGSLLVQAQEAAPSKRTAPAAEKAPNSAPQTTLRSQRLATRKARAVYEIARATRELAEIAVEQYALATYPRDLASVDGEIKLAESDLARAKDQLERLKRLAHKRFPPGAGLISAELFLKRAKFALEQAQSKKKVLLGYTKPKRLKELEVAVEKARSDEVAKRTAWEQEKAKQFILERQMIRVRGDFDFTTA